MLEPVKKGKMAANALKPAFTVTSSPVRYQIPMKITSVFVCPHAFLLVYRYYDEELAE